MAENNEQRSNWLANLTGIFAWLLLIGGVLYGVLQLIFVGFWAGLLIAAGVSIVCVLFALGLLILSHVLSRLGSIEQTVGQLQKKS